MFYFEVYGQNVVFEPYFYVVNMLGYTYPQHPLGKAYINESTWTFQCIKNMCAITGNKLFYVKTSSNGGRYEIIQTPDGL